VSSRRPIGPAFLAAVFVLVCGVAGVLGDYYPIHVGFMSHMHQPVYYPYESIIETEAAQRFSFSVIDVHNQRFRPCTTWPRAAVPAGLGLPKSPDPAGYWPALQRRHRSAPPCGDFFAGAGMGFGLGATNSLPLAIR